MVKKYEYYYNNTPDFGLVRNNLIYTSLIATDKKTFIQWYYNDSGYHKNQNEVVDPSKMEEKWKREVKFLSLMIENYPELVSNMIEFDHKERKIYHAIDGVDFWQRSLDANCSFDDILPDWQDQMLNIIKAHKKLGLYKFSMHPSSYFIVNGKLKSINYFFTYSSSEGPISIADHSSHISLNRQKEIRKHTDQLGIKWDDPQSLGLLERICWDSFRTNYPKVFIERVINELS
jgi:hypothetical protein